MTAKAAASQIPEVLDTAHCWFWGSKETTTLKVGTLEIEVLNDLTARDAFVLIKGLSKKEEWREFSLRRAAAFVQGWNLPKELPTENAEKIELFRSMRQGQFERMYAAIVTHEGRRSRRVYKGKFYTESEWGDYAKALKVKPPKWDALLDYIEPDVSIDADAWFVADDEGVTLQLPDGHWMRIKSELTQGEHLQILMEAEKDSEERSDSGWIGALKLSFYIRDWSLTYPDGRKAPVSYDSVVEMDSQKFFTMKNTIDAYEASLKKERDEHPTGAQ
jgi:hypothetical protein